MIDLNTFPKCHIEDSYFAVSRFFISGVYDINFFLKSEMLVYLDLCRVKYTSNGISAAGHKSFIKQFKYINPVDYKRFICRFIDNKFITVERVAGKITYHGILIPPLIDRLTHEVLQIYPDILSSTFSLNVKKHNYIRLPKETFLGLIKSLTLKEIYVLLKLYRYNGLYTFGGCEDSIINNTNGFFLHENFYKDIYLFRHEAVDIINMFIKISLASWVKIVKKETIIDGRSYYFYVDDFTRFKGNLTSKHNRTEVVLRLYHQPPLIKEDDYV